MHDAVKTNLKHLSLDHNVFITWKPEYDLGIHIIDEQHRGVVSIINSLYYAIQNKYGENMLTPTINMIHQYTRIHFNLEEDFLEKCDFPHLKEHRELHKELIDTLSKFEKESKWNHDPHQFMDFLKTWWINHICNKDRIFLNHISEYKKA